MQCKETEARLNGLLDERQPWSSDPQLAAHLSHCAACRRRAVGYQQLVDGVDAQADAPPLPAAFTTRVVRKAQERAMPQHAAPVARTVTAAMAIAAALLIAAWPLRTFFAGQDRQPTTRPHKLVEVSPSGVGNEFPVPLLAMGYELSHETGHQRLWLATGRSLATIPATVRRAADLDEGLSGTLRPVATSVGTTIEALSKMLPTSDMPPEMTNGGTGAVAPAPPSIVV